MSQTNPLPPQYSYPEEDELSLIDLWNIVWKRKWLWLTLGPLAGIIGIFVALDSTEIYRSQVLLAPADENESGGGLAALAGQFGGLASMAGINIGGGGDTVTAIATLKSRKFLLPFLLDKNLTTTLFRDEWDAESKTWIGTSERRGLEGKPTDVELYERFSEEILRVSEDKKTGMVTLGIEWEDPELTTIWANELSELINSHLKEKAKAETEKNLEYLETQLTETQVIEIRESLYDLIESQTQSAMLANAREEYAFRIIDPAFVPEERIRPNRLRIVMASGILGGFLGIFLCFVFHSVDTAKKLKIDGALA
jgi:uncharacterized protein involved in exopolysaccharide biosynthesis